MTGQQKQPQQQQIKKKHHKMTSISEEHQINNTRNYFSDINDALTVGRHFEINFFFDAIVTKTAHRLDVEQQPGK